MRYSLLNHWHQLVLDSVKSREVKLSQGKDYIVSWNSAWNSAAAVSADRQKEGKC